MANPFLEQQQQQFLNMWADNVAKIPGMEAYAEMYRNAAPNTAEYWSKIAQAAQDPAEFWKNIMAAVPGADAWMQAMPEMPNPMEQLQKLFNGVQNPMDFWKNVPGVNAWAQLPQMPNVMDMFKNIPGMDAWTQALNSMPNPMEQWTKLAQDPMAFWKNMPGADAWTKFLPTTVPGMDVYAKMQELWKGLQDPTTFVQTFQDKYTDLMQSAIQGFLPAGMGQLFAQPKQLMDSLVALYRYLFGPWMQIDEGILSRVAAGDTKAYIEFFKQFQDKYSETFQKLFNMMGMGVNREANGDVMHLVDTMFQALYATGELVALINDTWQESGKKLVTSYQNAIAEGKTIATYRDFYNLWFKETEGALEALFDTDEFAKTFGNFADVWCQWTIANNKVIERTLSQLPIPTKTDMESLYKTVYELRKAVRDLNRELDALKAPKADK